MNSICNSTPGGADMLDSLVPVAKMIGYPKKSWRIMAYPCSDTMPVGFLWNCCFFVAIEEYPFEGEKISMEELGALKFMNS